MTEWILGIYEEPLEAILEEGKEVEVRVPDPSTEEKRYGDIEPGDTLRFELKSDNGSELLDLAFEVSYNNHYDTVREALETESLERTIPWVDSVEAGVELCRSFPGYAERIEKYGVHAIGLGDRVE